MNVTIAAKQKYIEDAIHQLGEELYYDGKYELAIEVLDHAKSLGERNSEIKIRHALQTGGSLAHICSLVFSEIIDVYIMNRTRFEDPIFTDKLETKVFIHKIFKSLSVTPEVFICYIDRARHCERPLYLLELVRDYTDYYIDAHPEIEKTKIEEYRKLHHLTSFGVNEIWALVQKRKEQ